MYAAETWTLTKASKKLLEAFEVWMWWRMLKSFMTENVINKEVLVRANEARDIGPIENYLAQEAQMA